MTDGIPFSGASVDDKCAHCGEPIRPPAKVIAYIDKRNHKDVPIRMMVHLECATSFFGPGFTLKKTTQ